MGNVTLYKSEGAPQLINNAVSQLFFLPTYSSDLNPIEKCWANIKAKIKKVIAQFSSLSDPIDDAFQTGQLKFK